MRRLSGYPSPGGDHERALVPHAARPATEAAPTRSARRGGWSRWVRSRPELNSEATHLFQMNETLSSAAADCRSTSTARSWRRNGRSWAFSSPTGTRRFTRPPCDYRSLRGPWPSASCIWGFPFLSFRPVIKTWRYQFPGGATIQFERMPNVTSYLFDDSLIRQLFILLY